MKADCHIHFVLDGSDWRQSIRAHKEGNDECLLREVLKKYGQDQYTYLRDGGDKWGVGARVKTIASEYGITCKTPGAPICKKGHYGSFIGRSFETWDEYKLLVQENVQAGADFLKIMISGLMDFEHFGVLTEEGLSSGEIKEMIHIGKDMGLSVMAHANGANTVIAATEAGVDSIEHGAYLNEEALCAMKEAGTVLVPTLSAIGNLLSTDRFPKSEVQKILDSSMGNLYRFSQMDGLIACGSDAGAWNVFHAENSEMDWLSKCLGKDADAIVNRGNTEIIRKF